MQSFSRYAGISVCHVPAILKSLLEAEAWAKTASMALYCI